MVFVDTSALYALYVASDDGHAAVVDAWDRLVAEGRRFVTTSYVLVEAAALLQSRVGLAAARELLDVLVPLLDVEWVGAELHRRGAARLLREDRRELSLVDCVSFEAMASAGVRLALTLDEDFARAGFDVVPS